MTVFQAIFLGLLQGLTEFLPVSSSGHLALAQHLMNLDQVPLAYDVLLHLATLGAVCLVLFPQIKELFLETVEAIIKGKFSQIPKAVFLILVGSIPAAIFGLLLNDYMEQIFNSVKLFSIGFLITGILLTIASRIKPGTRTMADMSYKNALKIGLFQAFAILPSISRSGSTISASLFGKFNPETAFNYSFLLSIPAILGASLLQIDNLVLISSEMVIPYMAGFLAAFVSGIVALFVFKKVLLSRKLSFFAMYCLFLSLMIFFFV